MEPVTVWFNRNVASTFNAVESIRQSMRPADNWRIVTSHTYPFNALASVSDLHEREPEKSNSYVEYCLDFVRRHRVAVFIPGRGLEEIVKRRDEFADAGASLITAAGAETLHILNNKARFYTAVPQGMAHVPEHCVVTTLSEFDAAYADLSSRHKNLCFKPCVSTFGLGFHTISPRGDGIQCLFSAGSTKISLPRVRELLSSVDALRPLMIMPFLAGSERSVDCLAREGELVCAIVRRKTRLEGMQELENNPAIVDIVRKLTAHFRLSGIFNIQFRDSGGIPYLLEINARMSGGLHYSCMSGVPLPYWALRLALGTAQPSDLPEPKTGFRVMQVNRAVRL